MRPHERFVPRSRGYGERETRTDADGSPHEMTERDTERDDQDERPEESASPLRGNLQDNLDQPGLHDMGGDIGPADDTALDTGDEPRGPRAEDVGATTTTQQAGDEPPPGLEGALAVDSDTGGLGRDDPDDPAGGDVARTLNGSADEQRETRDD
jgi:hypothetical protein